MRKAYIDNIRWITVVLVVVYHVIYMFNGVTEYGIIGPFKEGMQFQDIFQYIVYPWFMLLLFVISGMSSRFYLEKHSDREFIKSRTVKLLVPSTIGLFVWGWITGYFNMAIAGAFESMGNVPKPVLYLIMAVSGTGPLWFIQLLWFFSVVLVLFRKIEKDRLYSKCSKVNFPVLAAMALIIWGAAQILNTPLIVVYRFGIYGAGFFIGYLVLSHDEVMDRLEKFRIPLSAAAAVLCAVFTVMFYGMNYAEHAVLDTFVCNLYAWTAVLAVLSFMKKRGGFENKFSRFMIKQSWGLYIFHYLPLSAVAWILHLNVPDMPAPAVYLLVAVSAFAGSFVLNEIIRRIPVLRWCVLGIGGKKNNVC